MECDRDCHRRKYTLITTVLSQKKNHTVLQKLESHCHCSGNGERKNFKPCVTCDRMYLDASVIFNLPKYEKEKQKNKNKDGHFIKM